MRARERMQGANLSDLFIMFIKWFAVFPVEESGDAHNFFLLVDNGKRQDVLDDKACLVHSLFLKNIEMRRLESIPEYERQNSMTENRHIVLGTSEYVLDHQ